jgi:hypothetical protein
MLDITDFDWGENQLLIEKVYKNSEGENVTEDFASITFWKK